jgi:peptidoglycan/LPS O-acetylase OafA/YrhL
MDASFDSSVSGSDAGFQLFNDLLEENDAYATEDLQCRDSPARSEDSSVVGADGRRAVGEEVLEGTRCTPVVVSCCPSLKISCLGAKQHDVKMNLVPLFAKSALKERQGDLVHADTPRLGFTNSPNGFWHFKSHLRSIFNPHRIEQIDGVRALLAIWTILSAVYVSQGDLYPEYRNKFSCGEYDIPMNRTNKSSGLRHTNIVLLSSGTYMALNGFLMLSGFLLSKQLIEEYRGYGYIRLSHFYIKRMARVAPTYFLAYPLYLFFRSERSEGCEVWTNAVFVNNYMASQTLPGCFDNSWIIALFMQLFLILPIVVLAMFVGSNSSLGSVALGWRVPATLVLACLTFRGAALMGEPVDTSQWKVSSKCIFDSWSILKMSPFFVGAFFAILQYEEVARDAQDLANVRTKIPTGSLSPIAGNSPSRRKRDSWESSDSMFDESTSDIFLQRAHGRRRETSGRKMSILRKKRCKNLLSLVQAFVAFLVMVVTSEFSYHPTVEEVGVGGKLGIYLLLLGPTINSIALGVLLSLLMRNRQSKISKALGFRIFTPISRCLFSILLVHRIVVQHVSQVVATGFNVSPKDEFALWLVISFAISLVCCVFFGCILYSFVEKPFVACVENKRHELSAYGMLPTVGNGEAGRASGGE